jgi:hypothetical protein
VTEDGNTNLYFNGDTSTNYRSHYLVGTGSSAVSFDNGQNAGLGSFPATNAGAGQFCTNVIDILDPFETTKNKTVKMLAGLAGSFNSSRLGSATWFSTNAVTTIAISATGSAWAQGTRISLYGIRSA